MTDSARIAPGGAGGFLNPPTHPEHSWHVETDLQRRPENRGSVSLSYAVSDEYLPADVRAEAARILSEWVAPPLDSRDVVIWLRRVFAYFANCYRGPGSEPECWHAGNLEITKESRPIEISAAVHLIRQYYPDFAADFAGATAALAALYPAECSVCHHHINAHANGEGGRCTVITVPLKGKGASYDADELCNCPEYQL